MEPIDVFEFMNKEQLILPKKPIFSKFWDSFNNKRKEIHICDHLLKFMGFKLNFFIKFLNKNGIHFNSYIINSKNELINNDIQNVDSNTLKGEQIVYLTFENLKFTIMMLTNKKSSEVKMYFNKLEEIFNAYNTYVNNFKHQQQIEESNKRIEEIERVNSNLSNFVTNIKAKTKNDYIYIATTKLYADKNTFKIGSTSNLIQRLRSYNTGRSTDDEFFFVFYKKVFNVNKVEQIINDILEDFKDKKEKEIVLIHYSYLEPLVNLVIENINEPYEYINNLIKNNLVNMYNLRPYELKPLTITEDIIISEELEKEIFEYLDICIKNNNLNLTRKQLLDQLNKDSHKNRIKLWASVKEILKWKNGKTFIVHNNINITITY